jgi:hypothetical protein
MTAFLTRRDITASVASCCMWCASRLAYAQERHPRRYCFDVARDDKIDDEIAVSQFSQRNLTSYLSSIVEHIKKEDASLLRFFQSPSSIYLDLVGRDAGADKDTNAIHLGLKFLSRYSPNVTVNGLMKVTGILAHETSHIFQYRWRFDTNVLKGIGGYPVKMVELHADYLAGAYIAWKEGNQTRSASELSRLFYDLGDRALNSEDHHGTEVERLSAYTFGYFEFFELQRQGYHPDAKSAATKGVLYVQRLLSQH